MNKAILIKSDNWEGLYVNGILTREGRIPMNEGDSRIKYFFQLAKEHNFDLEKMDEIYLEDDDIELTEEDGKFPDFLDGFIHNYNKKEIKEHSEEIIKIYKVLEDNCIYYQSTTNYTCANFENKTTICNIDNCPIINNL